MILANNVYTQKPCYLPCTHCFSRYSWTKYWCKDWKIGSIWWVYYSFYLVKYTIIYSIIWSFNQLHSQTNSDGRCPTLLPDGYKAEKGIYRVTFETQAFFSKIGQECFYPYVQVNKSVWECYKRLILFVDCIRTRQSSTALPYPLVN